MTWRDRAECLDAPTEWFFGNASNARATEKLKQGIELCGQCAVRSECLDWAVATNQKHGVWAGTLPDQRQCLGTLENLPILTSELDMRPPVLVVIGRVVRVDKTLPGSDGVRTFAIGRSGLWACRLALGAVSRQLFRHLTMKGMGS